jgi:arylamine N-acetyltransferase
LTSTNRNRSCGVDWASSGTRSSTPVQTAPPKPTSASPASHFTFSLVAARSPAGRRHALRNFDYSIHVPGSESEKRRLASPEEVCTVLESDFGIAIPDRERFVSRLEAIE